MQSFVQFLRERSWSAAYKRSINCDRPKGFSQRAHCAGRKKRVTEATTYPLSVPNSRIPLTVVVDRDVLDHHPIYRVVAGTEKVGYAKLSGDGRSVMDIVIVPAWQRRGIASALYDFIEQHRHITLRPSPMSQTPAGKAFWAARQRRLTEAPTRVVRRLPKSQRQLTVVSPTLYRIGPDTAPVLEVGYDPRHGWRWYGVTPYKHINTYHGAWHATKDEAIRELDTALMMKQVPLVNVHSAAAGTRKLQRRQP